MTTPKIEKLAERIYTEWINCTCVGDCMEKFVDIFTKEFRAHKAIMEGGTEPVARYDCESTGWDRTDFDMVESPDGRYVDYADYIALAAENVRLKERAESAERQLAELREKHEGLVARLREPNDEMCKAGLQSSLDMMKEFGVSGLSPFSDYPKPTEVTRRAFTAMTAVALREGE